MYWVLRKAQRNAKGAGALSLLTAGVSYTAHGTLCEPSPRTS